MGLLILNPPLTHSFWQTLVIPSAYFDLALVKTLIIKGTRSLRYGDVIKIIDAVKGSDADPIFLQIDDLAP